MHVRFRTLDNVVSFASFIALDIIHVGLYISLKFVSHDGYETMIDLEI